MLTLYQRLSAKLKRNKYNFTPKLVPDMATSPFLMTFHNIEYEL